MPDIDLKLVDTDDLVEEICRRSFCLAMTYAIPTEDRKDAFMLGDTPMVVKKVWKNAQFSLGLMETLKARMLALIGMQGE